MIWIYYFEYSILSNNIHNRFSRKVYYLSHSKIRHRMKKYPSASTLPIFSLFTFNVHFIIQKLYAEWYITQHIGYTKLLIHHIHIPYSAQVYLLHTYLYPILYVKKPDNTVRFKAYTPEVTTAVVMTESFNVYKGNLMFLFVFRTYNKSKNIHFIRSVDILFYENSWPFSMLGSGQDYKSPHK